ncbi:hypothetical protein GQ457_04G020240 [Hibiscus cannabinus]
MSRGMPNLVFVFYSNALASLILLPSSFLFHRYPSLFSIPISPFFSDFLLLCRSHHPPLTFTILCWFFLLGLLGCVILMKIYDCITGYAGIYYSSPTLATAMLNLIPGLTFILAVAFRGNLKNKLNTLVGHISIFWYVNAWR